MPPEGPNPASPSIIPSITEVQTGTSGGELLVPKDISQKDEPAFSSQASGALLSQGDMEVDDSATENRDRELPGIEKPPESKVLKTADTPVEGATVPVKAPPATPAKVTTSSPSASTGATDDSIVFEVAMKRQQSHVAMVL